MRHNAKRSSRGGRPQHNNNNNNKNGRTRVYDSNGPDVKIRGTAFQVTEKYQALARDAETSGNIVLAENYHQHAEHYQRLINALDDEQSPQNNNNNAKPNVKKQDNSESDDLGLPASITGKSQNQGEMATA